MDFKSPADELEEFLAAQPSWLQKILQLDYSLSREEFLAWLRHLEYGLYDLPAEDLVVYLRVPVEEAHRLVGMKATREYTNLKRDIQEANIKHMRETAIIYDRLATEANWVRIDCVNAASGLLNTPDEIHQSVVKAVESRILSQV